VDRTDALASGNLYSVLVGTNPLPTRTLLFTADVEVGMGQKDRQIDARTNGRIRGGGSKPGSRGDAQFINLELDKVATEDYRIWREGTDHVYDLWTSLLTEGYRVNTKFDDYSDACSAFIIPGEDSQNSGYILTGRGGNAYRAVSEALYKHEVLLQGSWGAAIDQRRGHDDPDF